MKRFKTVLLAAALASASVVSLATADELRDKAAEA